MPLTDLALRTAKPSEKPYKLSDGRGLYLVIGPTGGRWWRFDYSFGGKRKTLSLGVYPDVSLKDARIRRDEARTLVASDVDPSENRKAVKAAKSAVTTNSFEAVAREWFSRFAHIWNASHADRIIRRFERDIFPWIGTKGIGALTPPDLLAVVRRIEERGADLLRTFRTI